MSFSERTSRWAGRIILAAGVLTLAPAAHAQTLLPQPGSFELTPFMGIGFGDDTDGATLAIGAAGSYNFTTNLAFEGELGILPDIVGDTDRVDVRVTTFSANGVYHFDTGGLVMPYATLGIGFGRVSIDQEGEEDDSSTEFAVNFGGGVKSDINDRFQIRGDLRYFNLNDLNADFWRAYGGIVFKFDR